MAPNQQPIFIRQGDLSSNNGTGATANMASILTNGLVADFNGTGTSYRLVFTADPTYGSFLQRLRIKANCTGANIAAGGVLRVFINNGGDQTIAVNNAFFGEISAPAVQATNIASTVDLDYWMNLPLPPGFRVYVGWAAGYLPGGTEGWAVTPVGGVY